MQDDSNDEHSDQEDENREEVDNAADESESDEDEEMRQEPFRHIFNEDQRPLYPNATVTVSQAMLLIMLFSMKHKLTGVCIADLLQLLKVILPQQNLLVGSLYLFKKFFLNLKFPLNFHYYCEKCQQKLNSKTDQCPNCEGQTKVCYFITISIIEQLKKMFLRPDFKDNLNYYRTRQKENQENIEDIYDGQVFKSFLRRVVEPLNLERFLAFMWNTDGIAVFKSSKFSIWPFFLSNVLLPPELRFRRENVILAGLWFGKSKPNANLFLDEFLPETERLKAGVPFHFPNVNRPLVYRGFIICGTCDTPAKSLFLSMVSHNGFQSCPRCKVYGEKSDRSDQTFVYPNAHARVPRSDAETWENGRLAGLVNHPQNGMQGPSNLFPMVFNALTSTSVDFMHAIYSGIVKKMIKLWTCSKYSDQPYSLRAHISVLDRLILSVKPPHFIQRLPSSIEESLAYWKASQFRAFLFYYSLPVLNGVMEQNYFQHFTMLVMGTYILNKSSISNEELHLASQLLTKFVTDFEILYGLNHMTINFHLLHHLPEVVWNLGPGFMTSCFGFEDLNGQLTRTVHGTRYVDLQMCSALSIFASIPILVDDLPQGPVKEFCRYLLRKTAKVKTKEVLYDKIHRVGNYKHVAGGNVPVIISRALAQAGILHVNIFTFSRLKAGKFLYAAESYTQNFKMSSCACVCLMEDSYKLGIIKSFVRVSRCHCQKNCRCPCAYFAIVQSLNSNVSFTAQAGQVQVSYISQCFPIDNYFAVDLRHLKTVCWKVDVGGREQCFISAPINNIELE